ncbi:hypothetical protein PR048_001084, partial [Dryococelus australis]
MEVKCPLTADKYGSLKEAVDNGQVNMFGHICDVYSTFVLPSKMSYCAVVNGKPLQRRDYNYYYQVQGKLHITGRKYCYFVPVVDRLQFLRQCCHAFDQFLTSRNMMFVTYRFYKERLLEELVNPQFSKRFVKEDIKDPIYTTTAQQKA